MRVWLSECKNAEVKLRLPIGTICVQEADVAQHGFQNAQSIVIDDEMYCLVAQDEGECVQLGRGVCQRPLILETVMVEQQELGLGIWQQWFSESIKGRRETPLYGYSIQPTEF